MLGTDIRCIIQYTVPYIPFLISLKWCNHFSHWIGWSQFHLFHYFYLLPCLIIVHFAFTLGVVIFCMYLSLVVFSWISKLVTFETYIVRCLVLPLISPIGFFLWSTFIWSMSNPIRSCGRQLDPLLKQLQATVGSLLLNTCIVLFFI